MAIILYKYQLNNIILRIHLYSRVSARFLDVMYHIFICFKSTELHQVPFAVLYQISIWPIISDLQYAQSPFLEHMYIYIYPYI